MMSFEEQLKKDGASHLWASDRKQTTVIDYQRPVQRKWHDNYGL